jgi:hypothetical protein
MERSVNHPPTRGYNAGSYAAGCRCPGCTEAWRIHQRTGSGPIHRKANWRAAKWVRANRPDVWAELLDEVYAEAEGRRPRGRPPKTTAS